MEMDPRLLHGTLDVTSSEVEGLPANLLGKLLYLTVDLEVSTDKGKGEKGIMEITLGRTKEIKPKTSNQIWNDTLHLYCAHNASSINFSIKVWEGAEIGKATLPASQLVDEVKLETSLDVLRNNGKPINPGCKLHVKLIYSDVKSDVNWDNGVPFTYFPQRGGCKVTLYQDAHVLDEFAPEIILDNGIKYSQHRCWEDIFDAIYNAKYLIYVTGLMVYTPITLIRDTRRPKEGGDATLGEILKKKAEEGVRVLVLIWEDRTTEIPFNKDGVMNTHGKETKKYFDNTKVKCILCPRNVSGSWGSRVNNIVAPLNFSHHQKSVVVDTAIDFEGKISSGSTQLKRTIVSFVGGIDLCDGRYDTQSHSLFRTLDGPHHDDFYQNCFKKASIEHGGPRQPWHDIHCRLEGPVAWDVLDNFEQRWKKQGSDEDLLVNVRDKDTPIESTLYVNDPANTWNVQLFRSIDELSAIFPNKDPEVVANMGLVNGRGDYLVEHSIQDAYINAIRRAKRFIYIENQYFLGASYGWINNEARDDATHLIPKELSLKIVSKIENGERFSVYIVVPMWPEGVPDSYSVQDILYWQRHTLNMMYTDVVKALKAKGITADPKDYLSFFCLGNREKRGRNEYEPSNKPKTGTDYWRAQNSRRFMIYVHAKMMIVDDEYIIVGSANVNQRSMDGERDTEIAMGAFQPNHIAKDGQSARGQVHGFRMSLWYEHMGLLDDTFLKPESLECIRKVNQLAQTYWDLYSHIGTVQDDLPGHLLNYPLQIGEDGQVKTIYGLDHFPDMESGDILGHSSWLLPGIITLRALQQEREDKTEDGDESTPPKISTP